MQARSRAHPVTRALAVALVRARIAGSPCDERAAPRNHGSETSDHTRYRIRRLHHNVRRACGHCGPDRGHHATDTTAHG